MLQHVPSFNFCKNNCHVCFRDNTFSKENKVYYETFYRVKYNSRIAVFMMRQSNRHRLYILIAPNPQSSSVRHFRGSENIPDGDVVVNLGLTVFQVKSKTHKKRKEMLALTLKMADIDNQIHVTFPRAENHSAHRSRFDQVFQVKSKVHIK